METIAGNLWNRSKLLLKGMLIGGLAILLLIPTFFVQNLIEEREQRQKEAVTEVSSKWAGPQVVTGPMMVLPYWQTDSDTAVKRVRSKHFAYFLPDELIVNATIEPKEKYRGIYKIMLYNSRLHLAGSFKEVDLQKLNILPEDVLWNEAFVKMNLTDVKGLNEQLVLNWNNVPLNLSPQSFEDNSGSNGLTSIIPANGIDALKNISFSSQLDLNGSEQLLFTPLGKSTLVTLQSKWPDPSFTGDLLPQTTVVKNNGFSATWKSMAHKHMFPQQWKDNAYVLGNLKTNKDVVQNANDLISTAFGVNLFIPVNGYQKTMRSIKYAILCILLTFSAFFLIDVVHRKSVHPFQYGLIGLALVLFYVLLLSFSEYIGFDMAYAIAALATISLIAWFVKGILSSAKLSTLLSVVLLFVYAYVFTILQLQDYALLIGSIGLFISLAIIMHFSRKIQW